MAIDSVILTGRQVEALELASNGDENVEIAEQMGLGIEAVKSHLRKAYKALGARNRSHAVVLAYAAGVIKGPEPVDVVVVRRR